MRSSRSPPPSLKDYPNPPAEDPLSLTPHQQLLLIARHSPCLADECKCTGWKPGTTKSTNCHHCGHSLEHHGIRDVEGLDEVEKKRRIKVASRTDELLNVIFFGKSCGLRNFRTLENSLILIIQMKISII